MVELIHLATLVHDDSVDHSVLRRGMPTINSLFSHQISVIMGDYLYSRAVIELVGLGDLEPLRVLSRVTNEMTVGEMRQLLAHDPLQYSEEDYDLLIQSKTASLVSGACEVGALRAGPEERLALRRFGEALGMAFQIVDDLLDYVGDASVTGKPTGSDLREHKVTLPLIAALPRMGEADRRRVADLLRTPEPTDAADPRRWWNRWRRREGWTTRGSGRCGWPSRPTASWTGCPRPPRATRCGPASSTSWTAGADGERTTSARLLSRGADRGVRRGWRDDGSAAPDAARPARPARSSPAPGRRSSGLSPPICW